MQNTYGITENRDNPTLDAVLAFELGDISREELKKRLKDKPKLLKRVTRSATIIDYEDLT